jgi:DnaJ like chaperone protein
MFFQFTNLAYKRALAARLSGSDDSPPLPDGGKTEKQVNRAMFLLLGKMAKLDGQVTSEEIGFATLVMNLLDLDVFARQRAIEDFERGKLLGTDISTELNRLISHLGRRSELAESILKVLSQGAFTSGGMGLLKKVFMRDVAELFGFSKVEFQKLCDQIRNFDAQKAAHDQNQVSKAYDILHLEPGVDELEIKKAYLRMVSRHHPDKLGRQNLSDDAMRRAQEQFNSIRSAYEILCGRNKIRT